MNIIIYFVTSFNLGSIVHVRLPSRNLGVEPHASRRSASIFSGGRVRILFASEDGFILLVAAAALQCDEFAAAAGRSMILCSVKDIVVPR